jgi:hypothetical protein
MPIRSWAITTDNNELQSLATMRECHRKNANSTSMVMSSDSYHPTATKLGESIASVVSFIAETGPSTQ